MRNRLTALFAVVTMTSLLVIGCGSSGGDEGAEGLTASTVEATTTTADETTTTTADAGSADATVCDALKKISDYDAQTTAAANTATDWSELQAIYVNTTSAVLAAYDDAIEAADGTLKDDLTTLRDFTAPTAEVAQQSSSLEDFGTRLSAMPGLTEAGVAGQNLDTYSRANCGFGTASANG